MPRIRRIRSRIILGLFLAAAVLFGGVAAQPASASAAAHPVARPAIVGSIFGPCSSLQSGQTRWFGSNLYECIYIRGLGYYWVGIPSNFCSAPARAGRVPQHC